MSLTARAITAIAGANPPESCEGAAAQTASEPDRRLSFSRDRSHAKPSSQQRYDDLGLKPDPAPHCAPRASRASRAEGAV